MERSDADQALVLARHGPLNRSSSSLADAFCSCEFFRNPTRERGKSDLALSLADRLVDLSEPRRVTAC